VPSFLVALVERFFGKLLQFFHVSQFQVLVLKITFSGAPVPNRVPGLPTEGNDSDARAPNSKVWSWKR
jgi:hypothetical protein